MPTTTPRFGLRVPALGDPADAPADMGRLADDLDLIIPRGDSVGFGVLGYEDFRVRQAGTPNMSVGVGAGDANVRLADDSGLRRIRLPALSNSGVVGAPNVPQWANTFTAAHATLPRIDRISVALAPTIINDLTLNVTAGTASAGATLDNLTGATAVPAGHIHLADVLVPAAATTIVDANIRNRRPFAVVGVVPPTVGITTLDAVVLEPSPGLNVGAPSPWTQSGSDPKQAAALMFLSRRIVAATRIRWKYRQGSTANTGTYQIAICDASGRLIVGTGALAATGAALSVQERAETIAATTFEAGAYYVWIGVGTMVAGSEMTFLGAQVSPVNQTLVASRNIGFYQLTGGSTFPASSTIFGMTDVAAVANDVVVPSVPLVALSVG